MAVLSNINDKFAVDSTGAIKFNGQVGTSGYILKSNGNTAPTWVDPDTVIGGPYLPLTGGTLTGNLAISGSNSLTVGGTVSAGKLVSLNGVLELDDNGTHNGIINVPASLRINIDSDNNNTGESFQVGKNATNIDNNNILFKIEESGSATFAGNVTLSDGALTVYESAATSPAISATSGWGGGVSNPIINFGRTGSAVAGSIGYDDPSTCLYIGTTTSHQLKFRTNNVDAITISTSQNATFAGNILINNVASDKKIAFRRTGGNNFSIEHDSAFIYFYNETTGNVIFKMANNNNVTFTGTVEATNVGVNGFITHNGDSGTFMGWSANDTNVFYTAGNERLRIDANGVLQLTSGINGYLNTNSIGMEIDINRNPETGGFKDAGLSHARIIMRGDTTANGGSNIKFVTSPTVNTVGATKMTIAGDGNIGIGTTTPQTTLEVDGAASALNAHFGQGQNNSSGVFGGISLGYAENANAAYRKVAIVAKAIGDGAARQELHFLVNSNADSNSAGIADSKMMINTTGNVGIGTTSPSTKLQVNGTTAIINSAAELWLGDSLSGGDGGFIKWNSGSDYLYIGNSYNSAYNTNIVIANTGNVGIGTTSPSTPLMVNRTSNSNEPGIYYDVTGGSSGSVGIGSTAAIGPFIVGNTLPNGNVRGAYPASRMLFNGAGFSFQTSDETSGARTFDDKMKIEIGGNVGIGNTSPQTTLHVGTTATVTNQFTNQVNASNFFVNGNANGGASFFQCKTAAVNINMMGNNDFACNQFTFYHKPLSTSQNVVGTIATFSSSTQYNTTSDYRLKENVISLSDSIARLKQLKPSRFNFIEDPERTMDGFLAHEVQDIVPEAVNGEKDAVDENGNEVHQGIDQAKLVPLLVAAIQELEARVKELENK